VDLWTDGACLGNPGQGGYAAILLSGDRRKEIVGGRKRTTNNRMELMGVLAGLAALKRSCAVTVHTDSQYLSDAVTKGWARGWKTRGWRLASGDPAKNVDLWERLLAELDKHRVEFRWVRAHVGIDENERADLLSREQAKREDLPPDDGYESAS
jgi:ribonuclease HI